MDLNLNGEAVKLMNICFLREIEESKIIYLFLKINLFIYFWLRLVFVAARGLSL